jgi:hypothetical protein
LGHSALRFPIRSSRSVDCKGHERAQCAVAHQEATLQRWRLAFAHHLREQNVAANATERVVRGQIRESKPKAIYHTKRRVASTCMQLREEAVAASSEDEGCERSRASRSSSRRARISSTDGRREVSADPRDRRLFVRLSPEDSLLLKARALARGMRPATYVAVVTDRHKGAGEDRRNGASFRWGKRASGWG